MVRRSFSREFKISAVRLVQEQGYTVTEAARSLGVEPASIRDWVKKFAGEAGGSSSGDSALRSELQRLREENKRLLHGA